MNELKALRVSKKLTVRQMVAVVQRIYPKYDKVTHSKCENSDVYGVTLPKDAMTALYEAFDQERASAQSAHRKDRHRLTCSVRARLETSVFDLLQQRIRADGYDTAQDWLTDVITSYLDKN